MYTHVCEWFSDVLFIMNCKSRFTSIFRLNYVEFCVIIWSTLIRRWENTLRKHFHNSDVDPGFWSETSMLEFLPKSPQSFIFSKNYSFWFIWQLLNLQKNIMGWRQGLWASLIHVYPWQSMLHRLFMLSRLFAFKFLQTTSAMMCRPWSSWWKQRTLSSLQLVRKKPMCFFVFFEWSKDVSLLCSFVHVTLDDLISIGNAAERSTASAGPAKLGSAEAFSSFAKHPRTYPCMDTNVIVTCTRWREWDQKCKSSHPQRATNSSWFSVKKKIHCLIMRKIRRTKYGWVPVNSKMIQWVMFFQIYWI